MKLIAAAGRMILVGALGGMLVSCASTRSVSTREEATAPEGQSGSSTGQEGTAVRTRKNYGWHRPGWINM